MPPPHRDTYASIQTSLHWLVVILIVSQLISSGGMSRAYEGVTDADEPYTGTAVVHGVIGVCILLAMLSRLGLRFSLGVPPAPANEPGPVQILSRANHYAFYVLLIAMPLAGLGAVFLGIGWLATLHSLASKLLLALIALHFLGAMWHVTKRDGVIARMLPGSQKAKG